MGETDGTLKKQKRDKYGAFLLYTADWLSSTAIELMTAGEERGYLRLLMHAWQSPDCGLPDDNRTLAVLSKLGAEWEAGSGAVLRRQFVARGARLFNERLLEEREHQRQYRQSRSDASRKGNGARWGSAADALQIRGGCVADPNSNSNSINNTDLVLLCYKVLKPLRFLAAGGYPLDEWVLSERIFRQSRRFIDWSGQR